MESLASLLPAWIADADVALLGRLLMALILGAAIGMERELSGKPAGLRTNALICVGAELLTELSILAATQVSHELIQADPARIAAQIVSGIGFIGAGTILVARGNILGLTTAATLWVVAAIGMTVGLQLYFEALGATLVVVLLLFAVGRFEARVLPERSEQMLEVVIEGRQSDPGTVEGLFEELELRYRRVAHERRQTAASFSYTMHGSLRKRQSLLHRLAEMKDVRTARFE